MIQKLRNPYVMKWGLKAILVVTIPAFVLFYGFSGSGNAPVDTGPLVTLKTDQGTVELNRHQLGQIKDDAVQYYLKLGMMSGQISAQQASQAQSNIKSSISPMEVAEFAMGEVALEQRLDREGVRVTDDQVAMSLKDQGVTKTRLAQYLKSQGIDQFRFSQLEKRRIKNNLAQQSIERIARTSMLELWNEYQLSNELLTAESVAISIPMQSELEVTEEEILASYNKMVENRDRMVIDEEKRVYEYVNIPAPVLNVATPTDEEIQAAYDEADEDDTELMAEAGPKVRHLDVEFPEGMTDEEKTLQKTQLNQALLLVRSGIAFEEAAEELEAPVALARDTMKGYWYSLPITGDMGDEWVEYIETAEASKVSDVIETPKGFSFVEVLDRREEGKIAFEDAKEILSVRLYEVNSEIAQEERNLQIENNLEDMDELVATQTTLKGIARELNLDVQRTSPTLTSSEKIRGIGDLTRDFEAIEYLEPNTISDVVQSVDEKGEITGNVAVVSIVEVMEERVKDLPEVTEQIKRDLQRGKEVDIAIAKLEDIGAKVAEGETFTSATLTMDDSLKVKVLEPFLRQPGREAPSELRMVQNLDMDLVRAKEGDVVVLKAGYSEFVFQVIGLYVEKVEAPTIADFMTAVKEDGLEIQYIMAKRQGYLEEYRRDAQNMLEAEISEALVPKTEED